MWPKLTVGNLARQAGHYKELESILLRFEQVTHTPSDANVRLAEGDSDGAVGEATAETQSGGRQTFLFSATLMLPPVAREVNAQRLKKHKPLASDSTMDKLLRTIKFHNTMKVVDLTRSQLVAARLQQKKVACLQAMLNTSFLPLRIPICLPHGPTLVYILLAARKRDISFPCVTQPSWSSHRLL